jgi:aspartate 1-decarboxylase
MITRQMCGAKIHRLKITDTRLDYEGSLTVDEALLDESGILPFEKVQVVNINNGNRFDTYIIKGKKGSGVVCLNGAAARLGEKGDLVIVISYVAVDEGSLGTFKAKIVHVDEKNMIIKR